MFLLRYFGFANPNVLLIIVFAVPLCIDVFYQEILKIESTNTRRFFSGFMWGFAMVFL